MSDSLKWSPFASRRWPFNTLLRSPSDLVDSLDRMFDSATGHFRSEFHYGSFSRSIPLPDGVKDEDIKAGYTDGVLEVRTPLPDAAAPPEAPKKLPITRG